MMVTLTLMSMILHSELEMSEGAEGECGSPGCGTGLKCVGRSCCALDVSQSCGHGCCPAGQDFDCAGLTDRLSACVTAADRNILIIAITVGHFFIPVAILLLLRWAAHRCHQSRLHKIESLPLLSFSSSSSSLFSSTSTREQQQAKQRDTDQATEMENKTDTEMGREYEEDQDRQLNARKRGRERKVLDLAVAEGGYYDPRELMAGKCPYCGHEFAFFASQVGDQGRISSRRQIRCPQCQERSRIIHSAPSRHRYVALFTVSLLLTAVSAAVCYFVSVAVFFAAASSWWYLLFAACFALSIAVLCFTFAPQWRPALSYLRHLDDSRSQFSSSL